MEKHRILPAILLPCIPRNKPPLICILKLTADQRELLTEKKDQFNVLYQKHFSKRIVIILKRNNIFDPNNPVGLSICNITNPEELAKFVAIASSGGETANLFTIDITKCVQINSHQAQL
ncbi:MAG: hypothetical protein EXS46_00110 [Candidatus Taylorbacteria bacterium]|nr:hypothetical protein [Candidatus Taylorbacteria bacterium]